jgi:hypothetical protein
VRGSPLRLNVCLHAAYAFAPRVRSEWLIYRARSSPINAANTAN